MDLTSPGYLIALVTLPVVIALSWRSLQWLGQVRGWIVIGMRCLVVGLLVLALTAPERVRETDDQAVIFALDQSNSIPRTLLDEADQFVQRAAEQMRPGKDLIGTLTFAGRSTIAQLPNHDLHFGPLVEAADPQQTDIAAALRLGLASFPGDTAKRMVLLSDGRQTSGLADQEIDAYASLGIPIDVVPLRYEHVSEMLVERLLAPATAQPEDMINLQLIVRSQVNAAARVKLYHNDRLVDLGRTGRAGSLPVRLVAGPNRISIPAQVGAAGVHRFRAVIQPVNPDVDSMPVNNEGRAFTIVGGATRMAIVTGQMTSNTDVDQAAAQILGDALRRDGFEIDQLSLDDLPNDPSALADTSALILSNVSAIELGRQRQEMLASFVRDQGGGLIVLGGDQAFTLGGYADTPLEAVLPLETSRDKLQLPSLGMVVVIDSSGSMAGEKIAMARQAALASIKLLSSQDRVGVISFNGDYRWIVPLQSASQNRSAIERHVMSIGAGGGTAMYPPLDQAREALLGLETNLKHIIVLTDGQSTPGPFASLADACRSAGITISAVAVSNDADHELLAAIARRSGGRMYIAESARPLPAIFARETVLATRSGLYERRFIPQRQPTIDDEIMVGFGPDDFPPLDGYVLTAAKPLAQTPLVRSTEDGPDPILAYWQVGLGRSVAFTSGLWPKWGPEWVGWSGFSKFWTQVVDYVARPANPGDLEVEASVIGDEGRIAISAEHLPIGVQGSLALTGYLTTPHYKNEPVQIERTAAGRFEARFPLDTPGTYLVSLPYTIRNGPQTQSGVLRTGVVQSYSAEYRSLQDNEAFLTELASRTGGRVLHLEHPEAVFEPWSIRPIETRRSAWELFVQAAIILFLLDVAIRRLALNPAVTAAQARQYIHEMAGPQPAVAGAGSMAALRRAKIQAHEDYASSPATTKAEQATVADTSPQMDSIVVRDEASDELTTAESPDASDAPVASGSDYLSRLRAAKRRAREGD